MKLFLDGKYAFNLEAEVAVREGLRVGQALSDDQIEALTGSQQVHRCLDIAMHLLSYRPRSEGELSSRLQQRGFDGDAQEAAIARLKDMGLVDDLSFAQFWKDNRQSFSPRSRWLTGVELRRKGVANEIIEQVVGSVDDEESAYQAALSKARSLTEADSESFERRLGQYLKRRGFGYGVIKQTLERFRREQESPSAEISGKTR